MSPRTDARWDFPWTLAVVSLALVATAAALASPGVADALVADARIAHGQPWRAVTGPFVHATWGHLIRDLALVAIAGVAYEAPLRSRRAWLFAAGLVAPAIAVLVAGHARWYCGLSGLSHALLAAALAYELVRRRGAARLVVLALCLVSAAKPIYELVTGAPAFAMALGDGIVQVPLAHVVGVAIGIACGLRAGADARQRAVRATFHDPVWIWPVAPTLVSNIPEIDSPARVPRNVVSTWQLQPGSVYGAIVPRICPALICTNSILSGVVPPMRTSPSAECWPSCSPKLIGPLRPLSSPW